jgi:hypothetical protein
MSLTSYRDFTNYGLVKLVGSREKKELEVLQGRLVQIEKDPPNNSARGESENSNTNADAETP